MDPSAKGWWETSDAGQMNDDSEQKKEVKANAGFTSQYGLTGQSGIGSSMFNISKSQTLHLATQQALKINLPY